MQKIIICEGETGKDLTQSQPLAGLIADGFEVSQVSGFSTNDNRHMCVVLLSKTETQPSDEDDTEPQGAEDGNDETQPAEDGNGETQEGGSTETPSEP
jgi:hypothetical protein